MSTITRTWRNLRQVGIKSYFNQMLYIGDTKAGRLVGTDIAGNKYFENMEELPLRTRWVEYAKHDYDAGQIDAGWHTWLAYMSEKPPTEDPILLRSGRPWDTGVAIPNYTGTRGAYVTYSTTAPKLTAWTPKAAERQ